MNYELNEKRISEITEAVPTASVRNIQFLLMVANHKGINTPEALKRLGATKNFTAQCRRIFGEHGLGLIQYSYEKDNLRVKKWELTKKGERFFTD